MRVSPFAIGSVLSAGAAALSVVAGLGWLPRAGADDKEADQPAVTRREPSEGEFRALVSHVPEPFRGGLSDADLLKELEGVVFAFDYRGGPIRLWAEVEEVGQETMPKRFPKEADGWQFVAPEGHVCFALRRGVSERISRLATRAGKKNSTESVEDFLIYRAKDRTFKDPKDNSHTSSTGHVSPLWYGWKKAKIEPEVLHAKPKPGEAVALFVVTAAETTDGVKEPRKAKLTLKAVFGAGKKD
ncbi:MAG: hypothetical protein J2P46_18740 [Zavarzinella sp.]|nr:hypothetical protein [Zavarzinella sp.]